MFREMRRFKQNLNQKEIIEILNHATSGVLALLSDDDYPYAVPVSYVYEDSKIYFHCASKGQKIDALSHHSKVSFCIIDQDEVIPSEYTTYFRSVILFGNASIIEDDLEKRHALEILAYKYSPDFEEGRAKEIESGFDAVCMVKIDIEHMSGKEAIELVRAK